MAQELSALEIEALWLVVLHVVWKNQKKIFSGRIQNQPRLYWILTDKAMLNSGLHPRVKNTRILSPMCERWCGIIEK